MVQHHFSKNSVHMTFEKKWSKLRLTEGHIVSNFLPINLSQVQKNHFETNTCKSFWKMYTWSIYLNVKVH